MKAGEERSVWQGEGRGVPLGSLVLVHLGWAGLGWGEHRQPHAGHPPGEGHLCAGGCPALLHPQQ